MGRMTKGIDAAHGLSGWVMALLYGLVNRLLQPARGSVVLASLTDQSRSKVDLIAENALLRQQLAILKRQTKRPRLTEADQLSLLFFSRIAKTWQQVLLTVQPATLLRWHRQGLQLFWKLKSKAAQGRQQISDDTIELIRRMARENRLWGAERIRGELLKLGIHVAQRTIQHYMPQERSGRPASQTWATFLKTPARDVWACDFIPVIDLLFQQLCVFFIVELATRRVTRRGVHCGVTRHPSPFWVAHQLREATPNGEKPRCILRDNDTQYGAAFDALARATGIEVLRTPSRAPGRLGAWGECDHGTIRRQSTARVSGSLCDLQRTTALPCDCGVCQVLQ
jgi:hypothetical protein